jgi:hypothetical protein
LPELNPTRHATVRNIFVDMKEGIAASWVPEIELTVRPMNFTHSSDLD